MRSYIVLMFHALLVFSSILGLINSAKNDNGGETKCKERERHALLTFKQGLQDEIDRLSTWKDHPNADCCKWYGVQCNNQNGHVQRLDLHDVGRLTEIDPSIIELQHLTYLDLSDMSNGADRMFHIPDFIGSFPNLRYLSLSHNYFSGPIPYQIGNLSQLQYLDLRDNHLVGSIPFQLGKLSQLRHLDLGFNDLVGELPFQVDNLSLLRFLTLRNNNDLRMNNQNGGTMEWPANLSHLKNLDLSGVRFLHNSSHHALQFLQKLPSLKELHLTGCNLSDANIPPLFDSHLNFSTSLTFLDLSNNHLTSASTIFQWVLNFSSNLQHLDLSDNSLTGTIPDDFGSIMHSLRSFLAPGNQLTGELSNFIHNNYSKCIANVSLLEELSLSGNQISGILPDLSVFPSLKKLRLDGNKLVGEIPTSIGSHTELQYLFLGGNFFEGYVSESHFTNLSKLVVLDLSHSSFTIKVSDEWIPPFQLQELNLASCNLNSRFPNWLCTQNHLNYVDMSNVSNNLDLGPNPIPLWFWGKLHELSFLNVSNNNFNGPIPYLELNLTSYPIIDLTSNKFEGLVPSFLSQATILYLSNNKFSDLVSFVCSIGETKAVDILDLSNNLLYGELPDCWNNLKSLVFVDLSNNKLSGKIPFSMGALTNMVTLILRNNSLTGHLPPSLGKCSNLALLDLGENKFYGPLPSWIGESFQRLQILSLRLNSFNGSLPSSLCYLRELQVLDLSLNNLSGGIPLCLKNFTSMTKDTKSSTPITDRWTSYSFYYGFTFTTKYHADLFLMWKGKNRVFRNADVFLKSIDLSSNHLTGKIPTEIENLFGLIFLNLSRNNLSGEIISNIGNLKSLEFLDLSRNNISGIIPLSLARIDRLGVLDLSNNRLYGKIPSGTQLQGFDASWFEGNSNLCGEPLDRICPEDQPTKCQELPVDVGDDNSVFLEAVYMSMGIGFFTGFCCFLGSILLLPSWKETYSRFLNTLIFRIFMGRKR